MSEDDIKDDDQEINLDDDAIEEEEDLLGDDPEVPLSQVGKQHKHLLGDEVDEEDLDNEDLDDDDLDLDMDDEDSM